MLSEEQFDRARAFIHQHARPLDQAVFAYEFNDGSKEAVLKELERYRGADGGFGGGIEPDIRLELSSVIATTVAIQYLIDLNISYNHDCTEPAVTYLSKQSKYDGEMIYFPKVPVSVMKYPRAPWWDTTEIDPPELSRWPNPNAEITGYLNHWASCVDTSILESCNTTMETYLDNFQNFENSDTLDFYQFLNWKRALPYLPTNLTRRIKDMILSQVDSETLSVKSLGHIKPQWLVTESSSLLFQHFREEIVSLLEQEISRQTDDGGWYPDWNWGQSELWKKVKQEWAGKITVELLSTLKYCDLLDV